MALQAFCLCVKTATDDNIISRGEKMTLKLYKVDASPPVRAVYILSEIYKLPLELIDVNLTTGAHLKDEYLKINPLHTVPVLVDDNLVLHDSHAILIYLAETYGNNDSLYPKDVKQRALIHQKLFFNNSILFVRLRNVSFPIFVEGRKGPVEENKLKDIEEAYGFLEEFLTRSKFIAGDNMTIADIAAFTSVTGLNYILPAAVDRYPKVNAWLQTLKQEPFNKVNEHLDEQFGGYLIKAIRQ